ncbi:MAG: DUF2970 domain-containing protein [Burkholderiaceae bacterium]
MDELKRSDERRAGFGETLKAVAWSFFGVRKGSAHERDLSRLNPLHVILVGVLLALLFVLSLVLLVRWVAG